MKATAVGPCRSLFTSLTFCFKKYDKLIFNICLVYSLEALWRSKGVFSPLVAPSSVALICCLARRTSFALQKMAGWTRMPL